MIALALGGLWGAPALAARPTEGGALWSFDNTDVVEHLDEPEGRVRVHYSVEGPNRTRLLDEDLDGLPDFAWDVGVSAADVLDVYELELGFRPPVAESELGLGALGGSGAFDFYLVDFAGNADGLFGVDGCSSVPRHCAGHMVMENDFSGYGYPSLAEAVDVLTSHELFHAVQSAYEGELPIWMSEGTAVWAERAYDPDVRDFLYYASAYLEDTGRSLDRPPTGPVPTFAYATALWWDFLATRHDSGIIVELMEAMERTSSAPQDPLLALEAVIAARGDSLEEAWFTFAQWNLATGDRAGLVEGYAYADRLGGVVPEVEGALIDDEHRFYPLAASYFRLDHPGGPVHFAVDAPAPGLRFALFPVDGGDADGPVGAAIASWEADEAGATALVEGAELAAGGYWLVGSYPTLADSSVRVRLCLGAEADVAACAPAEVEEEPGGCGCAQGGAGGWGAALAAALLIARRRRKAASADGGAGPPQRMKTWAQSTLQLVS